MGMKEINIARTIVKKRREKGMTQEDLAKFIGVSKASVSKWETGQSYPDITFLPQLATLFNITIDELIGYEPQMSREDIRKLYLKLSADFAEKPFDEVLASCREIAKKYYSCFPLLIKIGLLLINHSTESGDREKTMSVVAEARELFVRVKTESDDARLVQQALNLEAICALMMGNPGEVIDLLEGTSRKNISTETLLASAYQMVGKTREARSILQAGIYQHLVSLLGMLADYLMFCSDDPESFGSTYRRAEKVGEAFDLEKLHPYMLIKLYIIAAQGFAAQGSKEAALDLLEKYAKLVTGDIYPFRLKGDDYFTMLEDWFEEFDLGPAMPRNEKIVRRNLVEQVVSNPAFAPLADDPRYGRVVEILKNICPDRGFQNENG